MTASNPMVGLYARLAEVGLDAQYVRCVGLPPGWNDEEAVNPAVYSQALSLLACNLSLDLRALQDPSDHLRWADCGHVLYKRDARVSEDQLTAARCIGLSAARAASAAIPASSQQPRTAQEVREAILNTGATYVTLVNLLDYCWSVGIPVLQIGRLPSSAKRPKALTVQTADRPAIALCQTHKYSAWVLFWVAHELGHVARGHLDQDGLIVDQRIDRDSTDDMEQDANEFAVEVLTGRPDVQYRASRRFSGADLAAAAEQTGERDGVAPGVVALNYAWNRGDYAVGNKALSILEPESDPSRTIYEKMAQNLAWARLSRDNRQFLQGVTRLEPAR